MDLNDFSERFFKSKKQFYEDTHNVNPGFFKIYMHSKDIYDLYRTIPSFAFDSFSSDGINALFGYALIEDSTLEVGHPVIKCTWEYTL